MKEEESKVSPMTIEDFNELGIQSYAIGEEEGTYSIIILRFSNEKELKTIPNLEDQNCYEITKELHEHLSTV